MIILLGRDERPHHAGDTTIFEASNTRLLVDGHTVVQRTADGGTHVAELTATGRPAAAEGFADHEVRWKFGTYEIALNGQLFSFSLPEPISLGRGQP